MNTQSPTTVVSNVVQILKNNSVIRQYTYNSDKTLEKAFSKAFDVAGGMWDGRNEYKVVIL